MSELMTATGHGLVQPEYGWMRGVTSVTAARDWLAATSSDSIKGAVGWRGVREEQKHKGGKAKELEGSWERTERLLPLSFCN
jgi:hypothetical protein